MKAEDQLARESDVTVSTNITSYAEYKGFFTYVVSTLALVAFAGWCLLPDWTLNQVGINYYPDKSWSHVIPSWLLVLMIYVYVYVGLYNTEKKTLPLDHPNVFTDENSVYPENPSNYIHIAPSGVRDLPPPLVNEVLYGN